MTMSEGLSLNYESDIERGVCMSMFVYVCALQVLVIHSACAVCVSVLVNMAF